MFENPRRGRQARNFTAFLLKILDLKFWTDIFPKIGVVFGLQFRIALSLMTPQISGPCYGSIWLRHWTRGNHLGYVLPRAILVLLWILVLLGMCRWPLRAPTPLYFILWPIIDPILVRQICNLRDPNLVTFYLWIYVINPLNGSSS